MTWSIEPSDNALVVTMTGSRAGTQGEKFYTDLHETLDVVESEFKPCPVILTGQNEIFSAGLDLLYVKSVFESGNREAILAWQKRYFESNIRLFSFEHPLIAAVNGHAFAGGLITALCADWRLAVDTGARVALNEVPIGIPMPRIYLELIAFAVGRSTAARLSLFGEQLTMPDALRMGLFHELVPADKLLTNAMSRAASVAPESLSAFSYTKQALREATLLRMREAAAGLDHGAVDVVMSSGSLEALTRRMSEFGSSKK